MEQLSSKAAALGEVARGLKQELRNQRGLAANEMKACKQEAAQTIQQILDAVREQEAGVLESGLTIGSLKKQLREAQQAEQSATEQLAQRASEAEGSLGKQQELEQKLARVEAQLHECAQLAEQTEAALNDKGLELVFASSQHEQARAELEGKLQTAQAELQDKQAAAAALGAQLGEAEAALKAAEASRSKEASGRAEASKQSGKLQGELSRVTRELGEAKSKAEEHHRALLACKEAAAAEAARLTQAVSRAGDTAVAQEAAMLKSESECRRLTQLVAALERELGGAKAGQESSNLKLTELIERQKSQISTLEQQAQGTAQQLQEAQEQASKARSTAAQQLKEAEAQRSSTAQQAASKAAALSELSAEFERLSERFESSQSTSQAELVARDKSISSLREQLAAAQEQRAAAEAKAAESKGEAVWRQKMGEFEGLVGRLADNLRTKELAVQTLQATVQRECEERHVLLQKLGVLEGQLQGKQRQGGSRETARLKLPMIQGK